MHITSSSTTHSWVHSKGYHSNLPTHTLLFPKLSKQYKDLATWVRISQLLTYLNLVHREEQDHLWKKCEASHACRIVP
jgi:hypothetical protein